MSVGRDDECKEGSRWRPGPHARRHFLPLTLRSLPSFLTQICRATEDAKGMMPMTVRMEMAGTTT